MPGPGYITGGGGGGSFANSSGQVSSGSLGDSTVYSGSVASGQLGRFHLASGQLAGFELGSGSVVSGRVASGQIGFGHLADASVRSGTFASGQLSTFHVASGGILSGAIGSGQLGSGHLHADLLASLGAVSSGTVNSSKFASGSVGPLAGAGTAVAKLGGTVNVQSTTVGCVNNAETTLHTYTVPAGTLANDGDSLTVESAGTFANTAGTKAIKVVFGSTTLLNTGNTLYTGATQWALYGRIIRTGATTQKCFVTFSTSNSALTADAGYVAGTETLANALALKVTGTGGATNDVVEELFRADWDSAP